jgi:hypothetical protein
MSEPCRLPILCLDFDGTVNQYNKGWNNGDLDGVELTPGFFDWAQEARKHFNLVIYSSRSSSTGGRYAMFTWLNEQWFAWAPSTITDDTLQMTDFEFAHEEPPAFLTIDDRAIQFCGDWRAWWLEPARLVQFKPWNQGGDTNCKEPVSALEMAARDQDDSQRHVFHLTPKDGAALGLIAVALDRDKVSGVELVLTEDQRKNLISTAERIMTDYPSSTVQWQSLSALLNAKV